MAFAYGKGPCKLYYHSRYVCHFDLLNDQGMERNEGGDKKVMVKYANPIALIRDEWFLLEPTDSEH